MRIRIMSLVAALALAIAACGAGTDEPGQAPLTSGDEAPTTVADAPPSTDAPPDDPGSETGDPQLIVLRADGSLPEDAIVGCRSGPYFPAAALADKNPPVAEAGLPGVEVELQAWLANEEGQFWPQDGWRVLHATDESVLVVHIDPATGAASFMSFEQADGSWRWAGASAGERCLLQSALPDGVGAVEWRLDPAGAALGPETTSIDVLAMELSCASGQPMGDRLIGPEIVMTDTQVLIAFAARPLSGDQSCPSNPEEPVTIDLPETLGDREVADGLVTGLDLADFLT